MILSNQALKNFRDTVLILIIVGIVITLSCWIGYKIAQREIKQNSTTQITIKSGDDQREEYIKKICRLECDCQPTR